MQEDIAMILCSPSRLMVKLDISVTSAGRHCHVTVLTISVDADFLKVESKEKVAVAETPKQGKEVKAGVATLTI